MFGVPMITGYVRDQDDNPFGGIRVSDGSVVTVSDHDGAFTLEGRGEFVFAVRPCIWAGGDSWFTRRGSGSIVLRVHRASPKRTVRFAQITDTHISHTPVGDEPAMPAAFEDLADGDHLRAVLQHDAIKDDIDFIVATGDLTNRGSPREYATLREVAGSSPAPIVMIPGNHDHLTPPHGSELPRVDVHGCFTQNWERFIGPRWFSFDHAGIHFIVLDWSTHELGLDRWEQERWLQADLAAVAPDMPWVLLMHDQPSGELLQACPRLPVATISGHRHSSRVVEVDGVLHVNSPPQVFAGLDFSPASLRMFTWDGNRLPPRTVGVDTSDHCGDRPADLRPSVSATGLGDALVWRFELPASTHRGSPVVCGDQILVATAPEDEPIGHVVAVDRAEGCLRWQADVPAAVKASPVAVDDVLVVRDVSGGVTGLDISDGEVRWHRPSSDPYLEFAYSAPVVSGSSVLLGRRTDLRALDASTGELLWLRGGLSPDRHLVGHAAPVVIAGVAVHGFWPADPPLRGFDVEDGSTLWVEPREQGVQAGLMAGRWPTAPLTADPLSGAVLVVSAGSVRSVDARSGRENWTAPIAGYFNGTPAVIRDELILVTIPGHELAALDRTTGERAWAFSPTGAARQMASYARQGAPVIAPPTIVDDALVVLPCLDATLRLIDIRVGVEVGSLGIDGPIAAAAVGGADQLFVNSLGGRLIRLDVRTACPDAFCLSAPVQGA